MQCTHWKLGQHADANKPCEICAAILAEREACAKVCEEVGFAEHGPGREDSEAYDCADRIRMRSNKELRGDE